MKRSLAIACAVVVSIAVPVAEVAAKNGAGELTSAFRNEINQFRGEPSIVRPEGHISPFFPEPASVCDELIVGTWAGLLGSEEDVVGSPLSWDIFLDGEPLDVVQTPIRRRKLSGEFAGETVLFALTRGVPVIGTLDEGVHLLEYVFTENGVPSFAFSREIESSPANC